MQTSTKTMLTALLFALTLGLGSAASAQAIAPININTADAELLEELPGIGPSRAEAIIEDREANGRFESAEELTRVSGIGPVTVDRMEEQLSFNQ